MRISERPIWFVGDRADPVAAAIARRLPLERTRLIAAPGGLPHLRLRDGALRPNLVVIHRATLGRTDRDRLARLRGWLGETGRIILCVGPHARAAEIERWLGLVDLAIPDLLASTTIGRQVAPPNRGMIAPPAEPTLVLPAVAVVSTNHALRSTLASQLQAHRFAVTERIDLEPDTSATTPAATVTVAVVTLWDVPVLDRDWSGRLRRATAAGLGPVITLIGFCETREARTAREAGACLVLDLPVDAADLVSAVREAARGRWDQAHPVPRAPRSAARRQDPVAPPP